MLVKICGNTKADNLSAVEALQPDLVGLIFYPKSPRYVGDQLKDYPFEINPVGVFVNESFTNILSIAYAYGLKKLQLHGDESPKDCRQLMDKGFKIYKAFGIESEDDLAKVKQYEGTCDHYLFDTKTPNHGGSGRSFEWQILQNYHGETPFFLSGGIGNENIKTALEFSHPKLVGFDLNSKLEIKPGIKDIEQTKQIIETIRNHERN